MHSFVYSGPSIKKGQIPEVLKLTVEIIIFSSTDVFEGTM